MSATPERLHPTDDLSLVADDLADRVADLARAAKAADVPMLAVVEALDAAHARMVTAANLMVANLLTGPQ